MYEGANYTYWLEQSLIPILVMCDLWLILKLLAGSTFPLSLPLSNLQVYILRVNGLGEVDAALGLLRLETSAKQTCISKSYSYQLFFVSIHV